MLSISKDIGSAIETIKKFKLNVLNTNHSRKQVDIEQLKSDFKDFMKCMPEGESRTKIKKKFGYSKYDKLMSADREWMEKMLPSRKENMTQYRDYQLLDEEAYVYVEAAYSKLLLQNPSQRITKNLIIEQTPGLIFRRLVGKKKNGFRRRIHYWIRLLRLMRLILNDFFQ